MLNPTKTIRIMFFTIIKLITDSGRYMKTTVRYLWILRLIYTFTKLYISRHILGRGLLLNKNTYCNSLLVLPLLFLKLIKNRYIQPTKIFFVTHPPWIDQRGENNYIWFSSLTIKLSYGNSSLSALQHCSATVLQHYSAAVLKASYFSNLTWL